MNYCRFDRAFACSLASLVFATAAAAQSPINIYSQDWEGANAPLFGYAYNGATATQINQAGSGVGGSRGAVLDAFLNGPFAGAGIQTGTVANLNTTVSNLNRVKVSFDARVTSASSGAVEFYAQSFQGVYGPLDGTRITSFTPTASFQNYQFNLGAMTLLGSGDVVPTSQTVQLSWQAATYDGWAQNSHLTLDIDNIAVTAYPLAPLTLLQTGGGAGADNLATKPGATAFAKDVLPIAPHTVSGLNDGIYGNEHSWIGDSQHSYAGISLGGTFTIDKIAFGSENAPNQWGWYHADRYKGLYTLQYTTDPNPGEGTQNWFEIGGVEIGDETASPFARHLYSFDPVTATGIRLLADSPDWRGPGGEPSYHPYFARIDELEVYRVQAVADVPEPGVALTALTLCTALGGLAFRARRPR